MTVEQYDQEFDMLSHFASELVKIEADRAEKFVRGFKFELQGFVRAFRPTTQVEALRLIVDISMHERVDLTKTLENGSTLGHKRKAEQQPTVAPQRNLRLGGTFKRHRQQIVEAGRTLREIPICPSCGRPHSGRCLAESEVSYKCRQPRHIPDNCP